MQKLTGNCKQTYKKATTRFAVKDAVKRPGLLINFGGFPLTKMSGLLNSLSCDRTCATISYSQHSHSDHFS